MSSIDTRKFVELPRWLIAGFVISFIVQGGYHHFSQLKSDYQYRQLNVPLSTEVYQGLSLGSNRLLSFLLMMKVQLHDNQKGRHMNYLRLDYQILKQWMLTVNQLYPSSDYPAFLASRVYSSVKDKARIQTMIDVIVTLFQRHPETHWRRMTEATLLAKHELRDLPQALRLAEHVADLPADLALPFWARDMKLILLDELGEKESAIILISSMLQSGDIKDNDERRFLQDRLLKIQQELSEKQREMFE